MIYVGIDIAKRGHFAAGISSDDEILIEPFKFTNDYDGFYLLLSKLATLDRRIIIGLESTAHDGDNLVHFLITKDFKLKRKGETDTTSLCMPFEQEQISDVRAFFRVLQNTGNKLWHGQSSKGGL